MKRIMIAITITGVVIAGAIIKTIYSVKDQDKESSTDQDKTKALTTDFLL
jgi:uncharacterized alpha/beta hydrolase family protein